MSTNVELFSTLFYVGLALIIIGIAAAVVMFFVFDIPKVFAQVTGRGGKRTAERLKSEYTTEGKKSSYTIIPEDGALDVYDTNYTEETTAFQSAEEGATTILGDGANVTKKKSRTSKEKFDVFEEIIEVHTDEII